MYETVLVPTNRRETGDEAEQTAVDIADRYDAEVVGLFVAETRATPVAPGLSPEEFQEMFMQDVDHPATTLEQAAERRNVPVSRETRVGRADEEIVDYAQSVDADLVVMGTHGRSGVDRVLLGSTTERTLRQGDVPVLCVHVSE